MKKNFTLLAFAALGFAALTFTGCKPEPEPIKVSSVSLNETAKTLEIGGTVTLVATVLPEEAENKSVTWSCEPATGTVTVVNGVVTAVAEGTAVVTATAADGSGKSASCTITVSPEPIVGDVSISGDGFDIDEVLEIKYTEATSEEGFPVKVDIASARGIDKLLISISSPNETFGAALEMVGLDEEFDLANPDEVLLAKLAGLAGEPFFVTLPSGADVKGKTELGFDITTFIPLIFMTTQMGGGGDLTADFTLKVVDDTDVQDEKTLQLSLIDDAGKVSVTGKGFNLADVQTIKATEIQTASVKMDVASARGIDKLLVKIVTENPAFGGALAMAGLNEEFDLANPTPQLAGTLAMLPQMLGITLPYGEDVKGKPAIEFDVTSFLPVIFGMAGECTVDFEVTVVDDLENKDTKTLQLAFVDDIPGEVSIAGDGFDITQGQTIYAHEIQNADLKINVAANRGIENLFVEITSPTHPILGMTLGAVGLGGEFDLANPSAELTGVLALLEDAAPPTGEDVKGKTELPLNISGFIPMLYNLAGGECTLSFKLTANDDKDNSDTQTLVINVANPPQLSNGGFEDWKEENVRVIQFLPAQDVWFPYADAANQYWDTANKGISAMESNNITLYDETDKRPGTNGSRSAKMQSAVVLSKFAAGNIYTGSFGSVSMATMSASVNFGRPFTARPKALTGWYKASPGTVTHSNLDNIVVGESSDEYQIYVMLTNWTAPHSVNSADPGTFIDFDADYVIGLGQISDFNDTDTSLPVTEWTEFEIPITYKSEETPTHIVVVACASKYGDYFTGSTASVLQIDDFELVY